MMENLIVGLLVLGCSAYILRKFVFKSKKDRGACSMCDQCRSKDCGKG